ncbi:MAG: response regulator [Candidatus Omnitrophota bacterium]
MCPGEKIRRVLIIEDEKAMAEILAIRLKREGYEIYIAYDGEEGLEKIRSQKPDLVLLDLILPKLDGRDLLKIIKDDEKTKDIPVVILSGMTQQWDRNIGLELGADEYIEKPLDMIKLASQLKNIFRKRESSSS